MTEQSQGRDERGSAVVEFVVLTVVLLLPVIYLVVAAGRIQAATFAVDSSARQAARRFTLADTDDQARAVALAEVQLGLRDQGFDVAPETVLRVECSAVPCLTPGARVLIQVTLIVPLPGVPHLVDGAIPAQATVRSTQLAVVDRFRPRGQG